MGAKEICDVTKLKREFVEEIIEQIKSSTTPVDVRPQEHTRMLTVTATINNLTKVAEVEQPKSLNKDFILCQKCQVYVLKGRWSSHQETRHKATKAQSIEKRGETDQKLEDKSWVLSGNRYYLRPKRQESNEISVGDTPPPDRKVDDAY